MKKYANRMGLVFAVAGVCLTCCLISLSSGQKPGIETQPLTTLADLRRELAYVQMLTLPIGGEAVVVEGGEYLFEPAPGDLESSLLLGALLPQESGGRRCWPVILVEDPASRDTVILDAEGGEVVRLPCEPDYDPGWAFDILSPLPQGFMDATAYDPAKVALAMRLISRRDGPAAADLSPVPDTKKGQPLATKAAQKRAEVNAKKAPEAKTGAPKGGSPEPADAAGRVASALPAPDGQVPAMALSDVIVDTDIDGLPDAEELAMGKVIAWGKNTYGQGSVPATASNALAIAAGYTHNLALRTNGTVAAWGQNTYAQCTVPASASNVVTIAAGAYHSLARRADGAVLAWGRNTYNQCTVPALASNAVALTAGMYHSAALRSNGTVVAWGQNTYAQCTVPATVTNVVSVSAGYYHNLALRGNGSVVAWGQNSYGQCTVPAAATNVVAVVAGGYHSLALRADGSVLAWGRNTYAQCTVPAVATNAVALGAGQYFSFAIGANGRVVAWGQNTSVQCSGATNYSCVGAVSAGADHGLAIRRPNPLKRDTDGDGMHDGWEVAHGFDPLNAVDGLQDADNDNLSNLAEFLNSTDPRDADTDDDQMTDGWEANNGLDPTNPADALEDTDNDDFKNSLEFLRGTDPRDADTDNDEMPDGWEANNGLDPLNAADAILDYDTDNLSNLSEFLRHTDPWDPDTDTDGLPDGWEVNCGLDPLNSADATTDGDGDDFSNLYEYYRNSSPTNALSLPQPSLYVNSGATNSGNGTLQQPFKTLHSALQAAADYAIIQVADGVYTGADNRNLSFLGKPVMLLSKNGAEHCVIDCQGLGTGVLFENNEDVRSVLRGLTIRNGGAEGGAVRCVSASPLIQACRFESNGQPGLPGGAVYNLSANPTLENCIIVCNSALTGAGIYNDNASPLIRNCTLSGNVALSGGAGLYNADTNSRPVMINTIVWGNGSAPLAGQGLVFARHSIIEGGVISSQIAPGSDLGNSSADPKLTPSGRLMAGSPCIDAGMAPAPLRDIDGEARFDVLAITNGAWIVDIGADEFVDTDGDLMADSWELENMATLNRDGAGDFDGDGLSDRDEYLKGCHPAKRDTDEDGMPDDWELSQGFDPLDAGNARLDSDSDGLTDLEEFRAGTDPKDWDTDKDGLSDFKELRSSRIMAWGTNNIGQCNVPTSLTNVLAIATKTSNNYTLRGDGTFVAWPQNTLTNAATNLVSFATGGNHCLAQRSDGSVVAWGNNSYGQCTVPATASNALAFAAGSYHSLALRPNGTVVAWGNNGAGQCTVPAAASNVIAIAAGDAHSLALRANGTVVAWGDNTYQQCYVPATATNVTAIAAGPMHNLAILSDGRVIAWGANNFTRDQNGYFIGANNPYGQCTVPATATSVVAVAVGRSHSLAVRKDGKVIAWGLNDVGQCSGATNVSCAAAVAGGWYHSTALIRLNPLKNDTDGDGMHDGWELSYNFDPLNGKDGVQDSDADGLTNLAEFTHKTDPRNPDTDADDMTDKWELTYGFNPLNPEDAALDADGDGVSNKREHDIGSDPRAGYCLKENFENGLPSDWMQSAWPHLRLKWRTQTSWGNYGFPGMSCPTADRGQMLCVPRYLPGKVRIATPVLNLGRNMANVMLKLLYWKGSHRSEGVVKLNIYSVTRIPEGDGTFSDQENKLLEIDLRGACSTAWSPLELRLPEGSATRQLIFEYESTQDFSFDDYLTYGICLSEISICGDYGRVAYQPVPPVIENGPVLVAASREMPYSCQLAVRGGVPPFQWRYHWTLVEGALPQGLVLDPNTGVIQGFPVEQGQSAFSVEVKNDEGMADTNQFVLSVLESVTALSQNFDGRWIPQGWTTDGWGPCIDSKALNGGNTNVWGKGEWNVRSPVLVTPTLELGGAFSKSVLRFRFRNPLYTSLNYRDQLMIWFEDATGTRMLAGTQNLLRYPNPTWQIIPDTDAWKEVVVTLPPDAASGRIVFYTYVTGPNYPGSFENGVFVDDVRVYCDYADPLLLAWLELHFPDGVESGFSDDPDNDELANLQEYLRGTNPHDSDTDDDDLTDGNEVGRGTDPKDRDTDDDGLTDGAEVLIHHTDPLKSDTDDDGISDRDELLQGTNASISDSDNDGMSDGWEVKHGYPPLIWNDKSLDPDGDGLTDGQESLAGTDPILEDSDRDGVSDAVEIRYGFNPLQWGVYVDSDNDGLPDKLEQTIGANPNNRDSDGDSLPDGWEFNNGLDPLNAAGADGQQGDSDNDSLSNFDEYINGTSPKKPDTDGDGVNDGIEVSQGSNPCDKTDNGQPPPASELVEVPFSIGGDYASWEMTIQGLGPIDKRTLKLSTDAPGDSKTKNLKLRKGNSYRITMKWLRSKYSYPDWYCWEAQVGSLPQEQTFDNYTNVRKTNVAVSLFGEGWYVDNSDGLLSTHTHMNDEQGGNVIGNLSATLYVFDIDVYPKKNGKNISAAPYWMRQVMPTPPTDTYLLSTRFNEENELTIKSKIEASYPNSCTVTLENSGAANYLYIRNRHRYQSPNPFDLLLTPEKRSVTFPLSEWKATYCDDFGLSKAHLICIQSGEGSIKITFKTNDGESEAITVSAEQKFTACRLVVSPDFDHDGTITDGERDDAFLERKILRFWVNDDKDINDFATHYETQQSSDVPEQEEGNGCDDVVNGRSDLLDFTPLWLDLKEVMNILPPNGSNKYRIRSRGVKFVQTDLSRDQLRAFHRNVYDQCGVNLNETAHSATVLPTGDGSVEKATELSSSFLTLKLTDNEKGVLMVEGVNLEGYLVVEVLDASSAVIFSSNVNLLLSSVEDMYRWINLRALAGGTEVRPTAVESPWNRPDSECNEKHFVFVHGYNVNEEDARASGSEMFKRLYQSGSKAMYTAVTWYGTQGQMYIPVIPGGGRRTPDFCSNVINALNSAEGLASTVKNLPGKIVIAAHSLGNMVVALAIQDHQLVVEKFFMLNAAVAAETIEPSRSNTTAIGNPMVHDDWREYQPRTWTSCWNELFDQATDDRGKMTWKNRFQKILPVAYNYFSSGDEAFEIYTDGTPVPAEGWNAYPTGTGRYSWQKQELYKGRGASSDLVTSFFGTDYAGWGFRKKLDLVATLTFPFVTLDWVTAYNASEANGFLNEELAIETIFYPNPPELLYPVIENSMQKQILSLGIPVLSTALGHELVGKLGSRNTNMNHILHPNGWWRQGSLFQLNERWLHSDMFEVAYYYVYNLFDDYVTTGNLK
jgi:alpha-tubulin suppressor-like RCC1 family protein